MAEDLDSKLNNLVEKIEWSSTKDEGDTSAIITPTQEQKLNGVTSGGTWGRQQMNWLFRYIWEALRLISNNFMNKNKNLSDVANKSSARANLGLGTAATRNVGTSQGQLMEVGAFGLGVTNAGGEYYTNLDNAFKSGLYRAKGDAVGGSSVTADGGCFVMVGANDTKQLGWDNPNTLRFRGNDNPTDPSKWGSWHDFIHTGNIAGQFPSKKSTNGYVKLPNGIIIQWGRVSFTFGRQGGKWVSGTTFPIAFPNACTSLVTGHGTQTVGWTSIMRHNIAFRELSKTGVEAWYYDDGGYAGNSTSKQFYWLAIGY